MHVIRCSVCTEKHQKLNGDASLWCNTQATHTLCSPRSSLPLTQGCRLRCPHLRSPACQALLGYGAHAARFFSQPPVELLLFLRVCFPLVDDGREDGLFLAHTPCRHLRTIILPGTDGATMADYACVNAVANATACASREPCVSAVVTVCGGVID
jgi:hypothetical protein